jgi:hypothetical protein
MAIVFPWTAGDILGIIHDLCIGITKTAPTQINKVVEKKRRLFSTSAACGRISLRMKACYSFLEVYVEGGKLAVVRSAEIFQALRWIAAAIVPRNARNGLYGSRVKAVSDTRCATTLYLELIPFAKPTQNSCWTHMFEFACVVNNAPYPYHHLTDTLEPGLTLDFSLLVALAAVEREIISTEGVFLLGFDTALIPLDPLHSKRWHILCKPGKQITSRDIASYDLSRLAGDKCPRGTVSVGWCPTSVLNMGTSNSGVNTKTSGITKATEKKNLAETSRAIQFQFGAQGGIGGSALLGNVAYQRQMTSKQAAVVSIRSAAENFGRVTQASSIRVIVFDNKTKKAWMVPAVVALLFSSLCLIEKENFMRFEDKSGNAVFFTYASKSHNAEESAAEALKSNRDIFMRRLESYRREAFNDLIKAIWYDMTRGENICRNESTGQLVYEKNRVFGYDLSEAILGKAIHLRGFKADGATANWATLTKEIPVIFVADVGRVIQTRLPNGPGRLASFGAPNDGPVRGMHFGGLVRPSTESEYLGPDIDDCSFRIRF